MAPSPPDPLVLAGSFPPADRDQWLALVDGVLKGRPFDKVLVNHLYDGIDVQPLYTAEDIASGDGALGLPGAAPYVRGSGPANLGWDVRQHHVVTDATVANAAVLSDLERGATSLWIRPGDQPLDAVLDAVYLDLAGVVLDAGANYPDIAAELVELWSARDVPPTAATGGFGADPIAYGWPMDPAIVLALRGVTTHPNVRAITVDGTVWHDAGGSDAQELGLALAAGVMYLRELNVRGLDLAAANSQVEFRYAATADQFSTIAKLRGAPAVGATSPSCRARCSRTTQHAVTSAAMMTKHDPWVNMLRTTVACFGAAVGGADAITVAPFDAAIGVPDSLGRRIARNTQALLIDESNIAGVADPGGGSWYIEHLTDELAKAAWAWFREIQRAGGIVDALDSGLVHERLDATWAERSAAIARRKDPITGVSEFPDIAETPVVREPNPEPPVRLMPRRRYAAAFEALRDRATAAATPPTVFLANLGPVAVTPCRPATFAKNFFEAAGIVTIGNDGFDSPLAVETAFAESKATLACICSSDAVYDERADAAAVALRAAAPRRVFLAGRRETEGVDDLIYVGCNAVDVLDRALTAALDDRSAE